MQEKTTRTRTTRSSGASVAAQAGRATYESGAIVRAVGRAGRNPHLKGHLHEVLVADARTLMGVTSGTVTRLTKSATAGTVDLVATRAGKVVERLQLKDTPSPAAVGKLVRDVAAGKYRSARLVGTEETTKLVNAALERAGLTKRMVSSGVSSETTMALAQRAGAAGSGTLGAAVETAAHAGGRFGAGVGAGLAVASGLLDLADGSRGVDEVLVDTVKAGAKGYASGAAASAASTATGAAATAALGLAGIGTTTAAGVAVTFAAPVAAAVAVGWAVSALFDALFD